MGGIINFVLDENRVRFEINLKAAEAAHLKTRVEKTRCRYSATCPSVARLRSSS
jgi:hypothetical protein